MTTDNYLDDGLCNPAITIRARQVLSTVCTLGGVECPLMERARAEEVLDRIKRDPAVAIRLVSDADEIPHYSALGPDDYARMSAEEVFNRKRDLDVLQRLGLLPGDTRRARWLYELLFERIETPDGICAYDTPGWEGCPHARSGAYEKVRAEGRQAIVYLRPQDEKDEYRRQSAGRIANGDCRFVRPHHFMCMACWYNGGDYADQPRPEDTIWEILQRIRKEPDVPVTLVEGNCEACWCCDGYHPETTRCVHGGGLIRDYKKDLDVFQKLGLMPGATMPANEFLELMFDRIPSTRDVCGYGDGIVRSEEWRICNDPAGSPSYARTRETGFF